MLRRTEVAVQRNRDVVDPAAEIDGDGRAHVAGVHRHPLDRRERRLAGRAVAIRERPLPDLEVADANRGRAAGRGDSRDVRRRRGREFPVAATIGVGLERDHRLDQRELDHFEAPRQQRQQRDLRLDALGGDHLARLRPCRILQRDAGQDDLRLERQLELDRAFDGERAPRLGLDPCGQRRDEAIGIDRRDSDGDADQDQRDQTCGGAENDEDGAAHREILRPAPTPCAFRDAGRSAADAVFVTAVCEMAQRRRDGGCRPAPWRRRRRAGACTFPLMRSFMAAQQNILERVFRVLASLKTGITLLILVGIACATGTFILQRPLTEPENMVRAYSPPTLLHWLDRLRLTDVYHAPWFILLLAALGVSIICASIDRWPKAWRMIARPYLRTDVHFRSALPMQAKFPPHCRADGCGSDRGR